MKCNDMAECDNAAVGVAPIGSYSWALMRLREGTKMQREGWNEKGMYITLIPAGNASFQGYPMQDCIGIKTADNKMQPGWLASQSDMLADDWEVTE